MKKVYVKPEICVTVLHCHEHLLTGSGGIKGEISGYKNTGGGFSQEEDS